MKTILIILSYIFISQITYSNSLFEFEKQLLFDSTISDYSKIVNPKIYGDSLFFILDNPNYKNDTCYLSLLFCDIKNFNTQLDSFELKFKNEKPNLAFRDFLITDSAIYLLELHSILIFKKNKSNKFICSKIINENYRIENISLFGTNLFVNCITFQKQDINKDIKILKINIIDFSIDSLFLLTPPGIEYTLINRRNIVDFNSKFIAVASPTNYFIRFYNCSSGRLVDSITMNDKNWVYEKKKFPDSIWRINNTKFLKHGMEEFQEISQINKIYFIDSANLLVIRQEKNVKNKPKVTYDLWNQKNNLWYLVKSENYQVIPDSSSIISKMNINHYLYFVSNFKMIRIGRIPFNIYNYFGKEFQNLDRDLETYYIEHDPRVSIFIWNILCKR
ncbi:MAG: hypothetical protein NT007_08135 [Candidatus Kapabacteria bacterium]|nr:hypothetical protein [Candidatus Kapabacteria bacterium]